MSFSMRAVLIGTVVMMVAAGVGAQALTLSEAIAIANQESFRLQAAGAEVDAAAGEARKARAELLPTMGVSATYNLLDGDVYTTRFIPPNPVLPPQSGGVDIGEYDTNMTAVVSIDQVLYTGGATRAGISARELEGEIAEEALQQEKRELTFAVTRSFYQVKLAEKQVEAAGKSVRRSEENLQVIDKLVAEQEALKADRLGAEARLALDRQSLLEAENDLKLARYELNRLLGRDLHSPVSLSGTLEASQLTIDEQGWVKRAVETSPQLRQAGLSSELADVMLRGAKAYGKPKIKVQGLYSWVDNDLLFKGSYYGIGLNLSIPFLQDFSAAGGAVAEAKARQAQAESTLKDAEAGIRLLVHQASSELQQAYAAIATASKNLDYHQERYRVTQRAFEEQLATFSSLLDDHAELAEAELKHYAAHFQARLAEAGLSRLTGLQRK
jgi:outer membrane protein TolC